MGSNRASGDFAAHQLAKREIARERERQSVGREHKLGESQESCRRSSNSRPCGGGLSNFENETRVESSFTSADNYAIFVGIFKYFQLKNANKCKKYK